jgi:glycosyltransferase involved in cell wall biosynthesis
VRLLLLSDRVPPDHRGGAEVVAWQLAVGLARAGHDVHVACGTTAAARDELRDGVHVHYLHSRYPERLQAWAAVWNPPAVSALARLLTRLAPALVHAHNVHNDLSYRSLTVAARAGIPVVFTSHDVMPFAAGSLRGEQFGFRAGVEGATRVGLAAEVRRLRLRWNPFRRAAIRRIVHRDTHARTSASEAHRQMLAANGLSGFEVIPNAVDLETFSDESIAEGETTPARRDDLGRVVLFGGRITTAKGVNVLGQAFLMLAPTHPDVRLVVLGRDPRALAQLWPGAHRDPRVSFGGWLAGRPLVAAYRASDVVVVPSTVFDTAPLMAIEGMAAGRPVVASPYGGIPEYIVDGVTGLLVRPERPSDLAGALAAVLDDSARAARLGAAGRRRVVEHYSLVQQVARFEALYERVLHDVASRGAV